MEKVLSIIIPVYNSEKYLGNCLSCLVNQDVDSNSYEIIIINDGSSDKSLEIANNYAKEHKSIQIITQNNQGASASRNNGIKHAKGEYIYFIDADDYVVDNCFGTLFKYLAASNCELLTFNSQITPARDKNDSETVISYEMDYEVQDGISYIAENNYRNEVWWYIINKKFLQETELKFIEGRWMEDAIFTVNILLKATSIVSLPFDIHRYVTTPNSAMTDKSDAHYKKVIYDLANAAEHFDELINEIKPNINNQDCLDRIACRKESFSFFLLVRTFRSKLTYENVIGLKKQLRSCNAFPLNLFYKKDYKNTSYRILSYIFNNKVASYLAFKAFRLIRN